MFDQTKPNQTMATTPILFFHSSFVLFVENFDGIVFVLVLCVRWVEHDPMEILESVKVCIAKAVDKATADGFNVDKGLKAIGLTNQRETTLVWSKSTGAPLYNAIVWMDARTASVCRSSFLSFSFSFCFFLNVCFINHQLFNYSIRKVGLDFSGYEMSHLQILYFFN